MKIWCLGTNHKSAPVQIREKLAINGDDLCKIVKNATQDGTFQEIVVLSTCNRTEIYCVTDSLDGVLRHLNKSGLPLDDLAKYTYTYSDSMAVRQLLNVASGADSMVLGEPEILGQLKQAYRQCAELGGVGKVLSKLFQHVFSTAKLVRTQTGIGLHPVSVTTIVTKLAKELFADFDKVTVMLLGAGDTSAQMLKHLVADGCKNIIIANRTVAKSDSLITNLGLKNTAFSITLDLIHEHLPKVDIVVGATASPTPLIGKGAVEVAMKARRYRPLCFVDIAVPRDIEQQVNQIDNVYLYSIDDLQTIVSKHQSKRESAAKEAEYLIEEATNKFLYWMYSQEFTQTLVDFRLDFISKKEQFVNRAVKDLELDKDPRVVVERLAHQLLQQFLHTPTTAYKKATRDNDVQTITALEKLFKK